MLLKINKLIRMNGETLKIKIQEYIKRANTKHLLAICVICPNKFKKTIKLYSLSVLEFLYWGEFVPLHYFFLETLLVIFNCNILK